MMRAEVEMAGEGETAKAAMQMAGGAPSPGSGSGSGSPSPLSPFALHGRVTRRRRSKHGESPARPTNRVYGRQSGGVHAGGLGMRYGDLPPSLRARCDGSHGVPRRLYGIEQAVQERNVERCRSHMQALCRRVSERSSDTSQDFLQTIVQFGGADILLSTLSLLPSEAETPPAAVLALLNDAMYILRELLVAMPHIGDDWTRGRRNPRHGSYAASITSLPSGAGPPFILTLFALMAYSSTFDSAVFLVEEILADRRTPFPLAAVPSFPQLISAAFESPSKLACFCRLLALTVLDVDERGVVPETAGDEFDNDQLSSSLATMLRCDSASEAMNVTHANHKLLIEMPGFLERMLHMLRSTPKTAPTSAQSTRDATNMEIDEVSPVTLASSAQALAADEGGELDGARMVADAETETPGSLWLREMQLCSQQVEFLFVLSTLLAGKYKAQAQDTVAQLGLVEIVTEMFDAQGWSGSARTTGPSPRRPEGWGIHGPGCTCDPQGSLRTQLLRVVHNFVDRDSDNIHNKRLLMTNRELITVGVTDASGSRSEPGGEGLLAKLLRVLLVEPPNSKYRFWLSSCIETFLRGAHPAHQRFVAQSGLLEMLIKEISSGAMRSTSTNDASTDVADSTKTLQTSFDLLGEMLKFNPIIFQAFNALLTPERRQVLMQVTLKNLVDSNVFVRSVALSFERFRLDNSSIYRRPDVLRHRRQVKASNLLACDHQGLSLEFHHRGGSASMHQVEPSLDELDALITPSDGWLTHDEDALADACCELQSCSLHEELMAHRPQLLVDLLNVVTLQDINQENICCLNTALVFFIIEGDPARLLDQVTDKSARGNFRELLQFWQTYYARKDRDRISLAFSSNLPFTLWQEAVDSLQRCLAEC